MRHKSLLSLLASAVFLFACKKEKAGTELPPPEKPVLLKSIVIPNLPSPYYRFEYDNTGSFSKASFSSGLRMYDVIYNSGKISELFNNTAVNKDRLQYIYDGNKVSVIKYIDKNGLQFRRCFLTYIGDQLRKIDWEKNVGGAFAMERTIAFVYQPDGNVLEITDHFYLLADQQEQSYTTRFEQYDNKICTDDFRLIHENDDHLLLLPGIKLQKNNPGKVMRTGSGINYNIDFTYTYNEKNAPLVRTGDVELTSGPDAGQRFQSTELYSYY